MTWMIKGLRFDLCKAWMDCFNLSA